MSRGGRVLAATVEGATAANQPRPGEPADLKLGGREYRARVAQVEEPAGPPVDLAILRPAAPFSADLADNRLLIAGFLVLFVLLALASATFVSRALTGQTPRPATEARSSRWCCRRPMPRVRRCWPSA